MPDLDWYRELYRRVGDDWLWIDRVNRCRTPNSSSIIHAPLVEVYALVHEGRDEGLLDLDFRQAGQCEIVYFGVSAKLARQRRRPLADEPRAGDCLVAPTRRPPVAHLHPRPSGCAAFYLRSGFRAFLRQIEVSRAIRGSTARRRVMRRGMFRLLSNSPRCLSSVITGLVPVIHVLLS